MTYRELSLALSSYGVEEPQNEAALLLEFLFGAARSTLYTHPDFSYNSAALAAALEKRRKRVPLAYILGQWPFYEETYLVNPNCLVPRSDTELLVEKAIELLPPGAFFADLCTGSGCVAVSTLCHRPDTTALGVDLFPETLNLALGNAEKNGVSARFTGLLSDVLSWKPGRFPIEKPLDAIVSNPPYIPAGDIDALSPEVQKEPRAALDGGGDGLDFYKSILSSAQYLLKPEGLILFEIGYDQEFSLAALAAAAGYHPQIYKDLGGQPRVAVLKKSQ